MRLTHLLFSLSLSLSLSLDVLLLLPHPVGTMKVMWFFMQAHESACFSYTTDTINPCIRASLRASEHEASALRCTLELLLMARAIREDLA